MANPLNVRAAAIPGKRPDIVATEQDANARARVAARARQDAAIARIATTVAENLTIPFDFNGGKYDAFSANDLLTLKWNTAIGVSFAIAAHSDIYNKLNDSQQNRFCELVAGTRRMDPKNDVYSETGIHLTGLSEHFFKLKKFKIGRGAVWSIFPSLSLGSSSAVPKERAAMYYFECQTFEQYTKIITPIVENALKAAASA